MKMIILYLRALFNIHNIHNGTTCEISERLWEVHDYPKHKGGDGTPTHWHEYKCPKCGKVFEI